MAKAFEPNFKTDPKDYCKEELNKQNSGGFVGNLKEDFAETAEDNIPWESEQLAKSHGIYLEFNRAKTGSAKEWTYMIRITIPGGGPLNAKQWRILDDIAEKYTGHELSSPSLRLTTRQNIQYHWIKKSDLPSVIREICESGFYSLNGCGDNVRNVMGCPISKGSEIFDAHAIANEIGDYFRLDEKPFIQVFEIDPNFLRSEDEDTSSSGTCGAGPSSSSKGSCGGKRFQYGPNLLNRKFKIGVGAVNRDEKTGKLVSDNCVEVRTNDLGVVPYHDGQEVKGLQIYVGGGQGEKNGKISTATLSLPLGRCSLENYMAVLDAVVAVHQEWGDRQNRHWARLKYVIKKQGVEWYREKVEEKLGYKLEDPDTSFDVGARELHHGWDKGHDGKHIFGMFVENGRVKDDAQQGSLRKLILELLDKTGAQVIVTANQDLIFNQIEDSKKTEFESILTKYNYGKLGGKPYSLLRTLSGACVGRDTCRLTYTDSEKFEPELLSELEEMGWGDMKESIGITGCERQCFRPSTKTIGLVGTGLNRYQLRLMGAEDGRLQGRPVISETEDVMYLRSIPREEVALVIDALFKAYKEGAQDGEPMGYYHNRIGMDAIIQNLKANEKVSHLLEKTSPVKNRL